MTIALRHKIGEFPTVSGVLKPRRIPVPVLAIESALSADLEGDLRLVSYELPFFDPRQELDEAERHMQMTNSEPGGRTKADFDRVESLRKVVATLVTK